MALIPAADAPLPAISKAVPWAGEVRMKGRPQVQCTARSAPGISLSGTRA